MGGIIGGDGYTFQDRYIVCHIPKWLDSPGFLRLMNEATGDVDVVHDRNGKLHYDHVQIKDHPVKPSEFTEVVKTFVAIDRGTAAIYDRFVLASPALSQSIKSLSKAIDRYKNLLKFYDPKDSGAILKSTKEELSRKIAKLRLAEHEHFLLSKFEFDTGGGNFDDNTSCMHVFTSMLVEHPEYSTYINKLLKPVYSKLMEIVPSLRGKPLEITEIHNLIRGVLSGVKSAAIDNVLHVHNWTVERFDPTPTYELDWSQHFERSTRKVPDSDVWDSELIPQLHDVRQQITRRTSDRHIIFRGKCALSTGLMIGMAFPEVGNWTFQLLQPPATWRSDVLRKKDYRIRYEELDPAQFGLDTASDEIAVVFNITGDALLEVVDHLKNSNQPIRQLVIIYPSEIPGSLSISDDIEAVSLAAAAKDIVKAMTTKHRSKSTHLFYFGPLGLAIFLGQKLTSVGQIRLYEYQDPGYKQSCVVKT